MKKMIVVALFIGVAMPAIAAAADRVKVAVVTRTDTDAKGFTPPDLRDRLDSVKDLTTHLRMDLRRAIQVLKPTEQAQADVVIEVLSRETDSASDGRIVHIRLTAGDYSADVHGSSDTWRRAARKAAQMTSSWIRDNQARLVAPRAK